MNLEDALIALGETPQGRYKCTRCACDCVAFAMQVSGPEAIVITDVEEPFEEPIDPADIGGPTVTGSREVRSIEILGGVCTGCLVDDEREAKRLVEEAAMAQLEIDEPWNTPLGLFVKAERNRRINDTTWAVEAATSPLTETCRAAFVLYVQALHRLTLDFNNPNDVIWPEPPGLEYP